MPRRAAAEDLHDMTWLLPCALVLVLGLLLAAAHFFFMRWMAHQPEAVPVSDDRTTDRTDTRD
jgi:hypothetical protein